MSTPIRALTLLLSLAGVTPALAQSDAPARPLAVLEGSAGWAGFIDESIIHHAQVGAAARVYLSPRISLGPELQYMAGPRSDRDVMLTGNVMVDVLAPRPDRPRRATPFVVVGAGLFRHSDRDIRTYNQFTALLGVGVRAWLDDRVFLAGDARLLRLSATVGVVLK